MGRQPPGCTRPSRRRTISDPRAGHHHRQHQRHGSTGGSVGGRLNGSPGKAYRTDVHPTILSIAADAGLDRIVMGRPQPKYADRGRYGTNDGMSMGGMIAQLVAANYPAKTKSLVSNMSSSGRRGLPQPKPEAAAALVPPPGVPSRDARIKYQMNFFRVVGGFAYRAGDEELRAYVERKVDRMPPDPASAACQMAAYLVAEPRNELLHSVRAPTLVLHGADDPLIPLACGKDTADSIPGAELVVVPGMGHDFSDAVARKVHLKYIGDFLDKVEARTVPAK